MDEKILLKHMKEMLIDFFEDEDLRIYTFDEAGILSNDSGMAITINKESFIIKVQKR